MILTSFCFYENENKSFNIQDVELVYSYKGLDKELYNSDFIDKKYPNKKPYIYEATITNNSKFRLNDVKITVYDCGTEKIAYSKNYTDGSSYIDKNEKIPSGDLCLYVDDNINESDIFDYINNNKSVVITFEVDGKEYDCPFSWIDVSNR